MTAPSATAMVRSRAFRATALRTVADTRVPSGDQDGAAKKPGEYASGALRVASGRLFVPSLLAIMTALDPGSGYDERK